MFRVTRTIAAAPQPETSVLKQEEPDPNTPWTEAGYQEAFSHLSDSRQPYQPKPSETESKVQEVSSSFTQDAVPASHACTVSWTRVRSAAGHRSLSVSELDDPNYDCNLQWTATVGSNKSLDSADSSRQVPGSTDFDESLHFVSYNKPIYGTKDAPRAFLMKLKTFDHKMQISQ